MASTAPRLFDAATQNELAKKLKALHKPGNPVIFANAWDPYIATMVASDPRSKAIATASYAMAEAMGIPDPELTVEKNLASAGAILAAVQKAAPGKPVTFDMQDGYEDIPAAISGAIRLGAVGANIEDAIASQLKGRDADDAVNRIKLVLQTAKEMGVPDFVVNARTDVMMGGHGIDEIIRRGKLYLEAGATTIFVWGGPTRGLRTEEIKTITKELGGRVSCKANIGNPTQLSIKELGEIGVSRISVGPSLWMHAMAHVKKEVDEMFSQQ